VLAWGMVDRFSWLQGFAPRDDGLEVRCCPYDSTYRSKPLREALAASFADAA
jgi:endo-1,4-beta-xylanase